MIKERIVVPKGIRYISEWENLEGGFSLSNFKSPAYILNKQLTGCGFTEYCLTNNMNIILCSPRKILLENKEDQHPGEVYYFRNSISGESQFDKDINVDINKQRRVSGPITPDTNFTRSQNLQEIKEELFQLKEALSNYYLQCTITGKPCKILVTYDSFRHVKETLGDAVSNFYVVIDEFQSIFTDSRFKSSTEIEFVSQLYNLANVCFVSATPMIDKYLDMLDEFKNLPYFELDWASECESRIIKPDIRVTQIKSSINDIVQRIISQYRGGNSEEYIAYEPNGKLVRIQSREAVFYVNSVAEICSIIKKCKLSQEECNILCARTSENEEKIRKAFGVTKKNFQGLGVVPKKGELHKMFTFCTRTVYLGADFYSTNAKSYIFSDANVECLAVDITLDLPQILGRQRLDENPWKNSAELFYKPLTRSNTLMSVRDFDEFIQSKVKTTKALLQTHQKEPDSFAKHALAIKFKQAISVDNYRTDYVAVNEHIGSDIVPVFNNLVMVSEMRAFEIQQVDYRDRFTVFNSVATAFNVNKDERTNAIDTFNTFTTFVDKMKYLCSLRIELVLSLSGAVPEEFLNYYRVLGPERIYSLGSEKNKLDKEYLWAINSQVVDSDLLGDIYNTFKIGNRYTKSDIKDKLRDIYERHGVKKSAKATDLDAYFDTRFIKISIAKGDRKPGLEILDRK